MNKKMLWMALGVCAAINVLAVPVVTDVQMDGGMDNRLITVSYELVGEPAFITMDLQTNGVSIGKEKFSDAVGVNRTVQPGPHVITWRPRLQWPGALESGPVTAVIQAWPGGTNLSFAVVDLVSSNRVERYPTLEALPGGVSSAVYRRTKMVLARIPAAGVTWRMGSPETEVGRYADRETPHYVSFTNDYFISIFPVTDGQVGCIQGRQPKGDDSDFLPRVNITYDELRGSVDEGIDWPTTGDALKEGCVLWNLRCRTGFLFDLPTDAQWEFAARGGVGAALWSGKENTIPANGTGACPNVSEIARYVANSGSLPQVGTMPPNPWGVYDMLGTVWEFCRDWVDMGTPMSADAVVDPPGLTSSPNSTRARRGGCFNNQAWTCRAAFRTDNVPGDRNPAIGFRVVVPASSLNK